MKGAKIAWFRGRPGGGVIRILRIYKGLFAYLIKGGDSHTSYKGGFAEFI